MKEWTDSAGNVLKPGDIIRMYHFRTGRKKYYMYKRFLYFKQCKTGILGIYEHLTGEGTFASTNNKYKDDILIVERAKYNPDEPELKRNVKLRD